jgi:hypothetical protein
MKDFTFFKNKFKTRLIATKLSEENNRKRQNKEKEEIRKGDKIIGKRNDQWASINVIKKMWLSYIVKKA